jgi:hypothetical protein
MGGDETMGIELILPPPDENFDSGEVNFGIIPRIAILSKNTSISLTGMLFTEKYQGAAIQEDKQPKHLLVYYNLLSAYKVPNWSAVDSLDNQIGFFFSQILLDSNSNLHQGRMNSIRERLEFVGWKEVEPMI